MWRAPQKARAEDDIGFPLNERFKKNAVFGWIIFKIGILNHEEIAGRFLDTTAQRCAFAHVLRLEKDSNLRMLDLQFRENFARAIARAVIHTYQLDIDRNSKNLFNDGSERGALVVNGHHDRKFHSWLDIRILNRGIVDECY